MNSSHNKYLLLFLILIPSMTNASYEHCIESTGNRQLDDKIITAKIKGEISYGKGATISSKLSLERSSNKTSDIVTEKIILESQNEVGLLDLESIVIKPSPNGNELVCISGQEKDL